MRHRRCRHSGARLRLCGVWERAALLRKTSRPYTCVGIHFHKYFTLREGFWAQKARASFLHRAAAWPRAAGRRPRHSTAGAQSPRVFPQPAAPARWDGAVAATPPVGFCLWPSGWHRRGHPVSRPVMFGCGWALAAVGQGIRSTPSLLSFGEKNEGIQGAKSRGWAGAAARQLCFCI